MNVATVAPLAAALMRADAMRVLVLLRPTMVRFAPRAASASAAANPMPLVAPVIRICRSWLRAVATREALAATHAMASPDYLFEPAHNAIAAMCPNTGAARVTRQPPPAGEPASPWE